MNQRNNTIKAKVRNIDVGKSDCSIVLVPQDDKDHVILNRLMNEEVVIEPVTLTDDLQEIDGHETRLRAGYHRGVRFAVRPKPAVAKVAQPVKKKSTKKPAASDKD